MLKLAKFNQDKLQSTYQKIIFNKDYMFYINDSFWPYEFELDSNSSDYYSLEFVSVNKYNEVIGFLGANFHRVNEQVSNLRIINFANKNNIIFSKDLYKFLTMLFEEYKFRKICFNVVIGNPAEKMYDKYIKKYGGRIVGIMKEDVKLCDGKFYDRKLYEILLNDYLKNKH